MGFRRTLPALLTGVLIAACGGGGTTPAPAASATAAPVTTAPTTAPQPTVAPTQRPDYRVVAVGDSIPNNSPDDCPGCVGFVDQYGAALAQASGKTVAVDNLSEHTGLTVDRLLASFDQRADIMPAIDDADVIIVGIAHNDAPMSRDDDSCDGAGGEEPDWSKFTDECLQTELDRFRPSYEAVYQRIAEARSGKATILLTINRFNDWIGWPEHTPPAAGIEATARVVAAWNEMLCEVAEAAGFTCADISTPFNGPDGTEPATKLLVGDHTHPNQEGNDVIAEVLIDLGFAPLL